jgi:hypothetical protein
MQEQYWSINIIIDKDGFHTRAEARLRNRDETNFVGVGQARCHPRMSAFAEIGDELAVARALADLARKLEDAAVGDIEVLTGGRPVT